jgi:hypothetical protein
MNLENKNLNIETITIPETGNDESDPALSGLRNFINEWRIKRLEGKVKELEGDSVFYRDAASVSLNLKEPKPAYNPLASFASAHLVPKGAFGEAPLAPPKKIIVKLGEKELRVPSSARTGRQGNAAIRSRLRVNAINKHEQIMNQFDSLHPEMNILDRTADIVSREGSGHFIPWGDRRILKKQLNEELSNTRHDKTTAKSVHGTGKQVLKSQRKVRRWQDRLIRSESGEDLPAIMVNRGLYNVQAEIDRLKSKRK